MGKFKKENFFVGIICNILLTLIVAVVAVTSFLVPKNVASVSNNSEYNGTIYAGDRTSNNVSLMINVYWGTEELKQMLEILKNNNIKTTFFVGGMWAKENAELLKSMEEFGHEIANHGYKHKEHGKLGYDVNYSEIKGCDDEVKLILGHSMELFAPPGGSYNSSTIKAATDLGYKTIMWTRDTIDWRDHDTSLIYNRAVSNMQGGDLILMHPTKNTVEALSMIIEYAKSKNFNLTTVSKTLGL